MVSIARRNLFHDKGRLTITAIGIAASLMLIFFGLGMAIGTVDSMVSIVDHSRADIWVLSEGPTDLVQTPHSIIQTGVLTRMAGVNGVESLNRLIYMPSMAEKSNAKQAITIVGIDVANGAVSPWNLVSGNISDLNRNSTVIVDESAQMGLGKLSVGDHLSISNTTEEIVGITRDAKSFVSPLIFTSHDNAQILLNMVNETNYVLINVQSGSDSAQMASEISKIGGVTVLLKSKIRSNTVDYMLYKSGMGVGTVTFAAVGFFVATIIISLTIYTATMERVPEFGTLKAIGASKKDIYGILIEQAFWAVTIGYLLGLAFSFSAIFILTSMFLMPIKITVELAVTAYLLTLLLSVLGSFLSVRKVNKIDPAIVFRT